MTEEFEPRRLISQHLALFASAALILVALLRIFYFAGFNPNVALSVLSVVDRVQILMATLLSLVVLALPIAFINPALRRWLFAGNATGASFGTQIRTALIWVPLGSLIIAVLSIPVLVGWFLGAVIVFFVNRKRRRKAAPPVEQIQGNEWLRWMYATLIGLWLLFVLHTPWQPKEIIFTSDDRSTVGYVIGEQSGMTLLLDATKKPVWLPTESIEARDRCRTTVQWWAGTIPAVFDHGGIECSKL